MRSVSETRSCLRRLSCGQRVLYRVGTLADTHHSGTSIVVPAGEGVTYLLWPVTEVFMRRDAQTETRVDNGATVTYYYFYTDQGTANGDTGNNHAAALKLAEALVHRLQFDTTSYRYYIHTQARDEKIRHVHKQKNLATLVFVDKNSGKKSLLCETCDKIGHPAYDCPSRPRVTPELLVNENEWNHPLVDNYTLFRDMRENGVVDRSKALPWNLRDGGGADPETDLAPLECMANANDCLFYCIAFVLDPNVHFRNSPEQEHEAITKASELRQEACAWIETNLKNKSYGGLYHTSTIIDDKYIAAMRVPEIKMASVLEAYALCCIYKIRVDMYSFTTHPASCSLVVPRASDIHDPSFDYNAGMKYFCSLYNQKDFHWKVYTKRGEKQVDDGFFKSETAGAVMNTGGLYKDARYHDI